MRGTVEFRKDSILIFRKCIKILVNSESLQTVFNENLNLHYSFSEKLL